MSALLPIFVDVAGATITVTGDGPAAREITAALERLGARVTRTGAIAPAPEHLEGALFLVAASDDPAADTAIVEAASSLRLLTVSANGPKGRAFLGAAVQRGDLAVAATTSGQSQPLERRMAESAAAAIGAQHERLAQILAGIRAKLEDRIPDDAVRTAIWEQILDSPVGLLLESGSEDDAIEMAERMAWGTG